MFKGRTITVAICALVACGLIPKGGATAAANLNLGIPQGALLPFVHRTKCPDGWKEYSSEPGRIIVVASKDLPAGTKGGDPDVVRGKANLAAAQIPTLSGTFNGQTNVNSLTINANEGEISGRAFWHSDDNWNLVFLGHDRNGRSAGNNPLSGSVTGGVTVNNSSQPQTALQAPAFITAMYCEKL